VRDASGPVSCPMTAQAQAQTSFKTVQFGVPLSQTYGTIKDPPALDQYAIVTSKVQCEYVTSGEFVSDWAVFAVDQNMSGQYPIENQKSFFRVTDLASLPPTSTSLVRVTGYGMDGPPPAYGNNATRNRYSQTEQTAAGQFLGSFNSGGYRNLRYLADTNPANSGSPVILNGTRLTLGIHRGGNSTSTYNIATSFQAASLANALQAFPGTLVSPTIPGANIFYVDAFSPAYKSSPTGNLFQPLPTLTAAFVKIATVPSGTATLISVVTGSYPETIDETTTNTVDITVTLKGDLTLVLPVGDVTLWDTMQVPCG
jgi:hypothetical protein